MGSYFLFAVAVLSLSQASVIARWTAAPPEMIGFWRMSAAALILAPFAWRVRALLQGAALRYALISGAFLFCHLLTYIYAAQNTSIGNVALLFGINPILTSGLALAVQRVVPGPRLLIAYCLALAGLVALLHNRVDWASGFAAGDGAALASAALFSVYVYTGNEARRTLPVTAYSFAAFGAAALLFLCAVLVTGAPLTGYPSRVYFGLALYVLIPTFLGHALFAYLMERLPLQVISWGKFVEPLFASLAAYALFSEALHRDWLIAFALSGAGSLFLSGALRESRSNSPPESGGGAARA